MNICYKEVHANITGNIEAFLLSEHLEEVFPKGKFRFIRVKHHKTGLKTGVLHHYPTSFEDLTEKLDRLEAITGCKIVLVKTKNPSLTVLKFYEKDLPRLIEWSEANFEANKDPLNPVLGVNLDGKLVKINFEDVKSHNLLVAGLPGTGKTMLLKLILKQLLSNTELNKVYVFDFKGYEFNAIQAINDVNQAILTLKQLNKLINGKQYKGRTRHFVIIDEFAELSTNKNALPLVLRLLRMGRAYKIHCILCTQRPDNQVLPGSLKALIPATIAFQVRNNVNSVILLDHTGASKLGEIRGRAIYQAGYRETLIQVPLVCVTNNKVNNEPNGGVLIEPQ